MVAPGARSPDRRARLEIKQRSRDLERQLGALDLRGVRRPVEPTLVGAAVVSAPDGTYRVSDAVLRDMARLLALAADRVHEAGEKRFGRGRLLEEAEAAIVSYRGLLDGLRAARVGFIDELGGLGRQHRTELADAETKAAASLVDGRRALDEWMAAVPAFMASWHARRWADAAARWSAPTARRARRVARPRGRSTLGPSASFASDVGIPLFVETASHLGLQFRDAERREAVELLQSLALRRLVSATPGNVTFQIFDPVGLGQSVSELLQLADFDADLIGGKVWSSPGDLRNLLVATTSHIEMVVQKYLRAEYHNIRAFNAAAGDIAEPIRYLLVFDYPHGFDRDNFGELARSLENGPRCGVHVLIAEALGAIVDPAAGPPSCRATCRP